MKKKFFIIGISWMIFAINNLFSQDLQYFCILSGTLKYDGFIPNISNYIPDENTSIKYVRINVHYILLEPNGPGYPGNFTETDDGNGNTNYTGYNFAKDLIYIINQRLSSNEQMNLPPGNTTNVIDRKYRLILDAVYFHEDYSKYYWPSYPNSVYEENGGKCINLYLNHKPIGDPKGHGHANPSGNRYIESCGAWEGYLTNNLADVLWVAAGGIIHESGHNFSLSHTMRTSNGYCKDYAEDYCDDTPTRGYIKTYYGFDPCCGWNGGDSCSNNAMDYDGEVVMTPEQLGRVHWTFENEMENYLTCHFETTDFNICDDDIEYPQILYIAENIYAPGSSCYPQLVTIESGENATFVAKDKVLLNPGFKVELGGTLSIMINSECTY